MNSTMRPIALYVQFIRTETSILSYIWPTKDQPVEWNIGCCRTATTFYMRGKGVNFCYTIRTQKRFDESSRVICWRFVHLDLAKKFTCYWKSTPTRTWTLSVGNDVQLIALHAFVFLCCHNNNINMHAVMLSLIMMIHHIFYY